MYLTQLDHDCLNEAIDHMTVLLRQTNGPIEQDFIDETRRRLITLSLYPIEGQALDLAQQP